MENNRRTMYSENPSDILDSQYIESLLQAPEGETPTTENNKNKTQHDVFSSPTTGPMVMGGNHDDYLFDNFISTGTLDAFHHNDTNATAPNIFMSEHEFTTVPKDDIKSRRDVSVVPKWSLVDCRTLLNDTVTFGRTESVHTVRQSPIDYINLDESLLPYTLSVEGLPEISRVENQLKLSMKLSNKTEGAAIPENMIYLSSDCIARQKFYVSKDLSAYPKEFQDQLLHLEAFLVCTSNKKISNACMKCVKREQRRASRRKSGLHDNMLWCDNENRRAVVFNNRQVFVVNSESADSQTKKFELTARLVCYCRHHDAANGFQILFVVRNTMGDVLAKTFTSSIMITDKKPSSLTSFPASNTEPKPLSNGVPTLSTTMSENNIMETTSSATSQAYMEPNNDYSFVNENYMAVTPTALMNKGTRLSSTNLTSEGSESHISDFINNSNHFNSATSVSPGNSITATDVQGRKRSRMNLQDTYRYNTQVPLSNQYLSKTTSPLANNTVVPTDLTNINISKAQHNNSLPSSLPLNANRPSIQRVIPAEGPINGGIEVTLLGFNFKPNLVVKFGENVALSLQHWNESTIVTYLPPAAQAGPVDVTIMDPNDPDHHLMEMMHPTNKVIFTYVDDTDRQLLELALKIVGMKMNGKLEEARNVAKRILGSDPTSPPSSSSSSNISPANVGSHQYNTNANDNNTLSDEVLLTKVIKTLKSSSNISMCDNLGRTLLHLAVLKGYSHLTSQLIQSGARIAVKDIFGYTPLHFACVNGSIEMIKLLLSCEASVNDVTKNNLTPKMLFLSNRGSNADAKMTDDVLHLLDEFDETHNLSRPISTISLDSLDKVSIHSEQGVGERIVRQETENSGYEYSGFEDFDDDLNDEPWSQSESDSEHLSEHRSRMQQIPNDNGLDSLPRYEDIFPTNGTESSQKEKSMAVIVHPAPAPTGLVTSSSSQVEDSHTSSEDETEAFQRGFNRFFQNRQKFRNDKMLFFFWLPVTLILLTYFVLYALGGNNGRIHRMASVVPEYLRCGLAKVLLGNERMKTLVKTKFSEFQNTGVLNDIMVG